MSYTASLQQHYASVSERLWPAPPAVKKRAVKLLPERRKLFSEPIEEIDYAPVNLLARPSWRCILKLVALKHGVSVDDILGKSRIRHICAARQDGMVLVWQHCQPLSLPQVGAMFNRDHTTVLHALRKLARGKGRCEFSPQSTMTGARSVDRAAKPQISGLLVA